MIIRVHDRLVFVLAVNIQQQIAQFRDHDARGGMAVDEQAVAPAAADFAPNQHIRVAAFGVEKAIFGGFCLRVIQRGDGENRFNDGALRAGADKFRRRPPAKRNHQRVHHNRFPRAGFAGDDVQSAGKLNVQFINNRKIFDINF